MKTLCSLDISMFLISAECRCLSCGLGSETGKCRSEGHCLGVSE